MDEYTVWGEATRHDQHGKPTGEGEGDEEEEGATSMDGDEDDAIQRYVQLPTTTMARSHL